MEVKILEKKPEKIIFLVTEINETIANSIRRSMQEVPVLAIDEVEFVKNDSALYDEMLAHRLGLIPLKTEKGRKHRDECSCDGKGCSKCTVALKLHAKGPCRVYSSDLKGAGLVVYKDMPLVDLAKDQELELNAYAKIGIAKEHTKFSPGLIYFKPLVEVSVSGSCDLCEACVKSCPIKLLELKNKKIQAKEVEKCDVCDACVEACRKQGKDAIKIKASQQDFIFTLESWGQLSPKEILSSICEALGKNLNEIEKKVNKSG